MMFTVVSSGLRLGGAPKTAQEVPIPTLMEDNITTVWVGPQFVQLWDIDSGRAAPTQIDALAGCLFGELRDYPWRDDLNVSMRNRWELVMGKEKYYTGNVTEILGHPFKRKR